MNGLVCKNEEDFGVGGFDYTQINQPLQKN